MSAQDSERRAPGLDQELRALPAGIEPTQDLWPGIEARLAPRHKEVWRERVWQVAAAVVLVATSSILTAMWMSRETLQVVQSPSVDGAPLEPATRRAAFGPTHALGAEYLAARRDLSGMLEQRIDRLPPSARSKIEQNLAEMRRAADEINQALATQPGDPLLEELLLTTYQEELAVLASVNQLAGPDGNGTPADDEGISL
jgi:hypothetical protein